MAHFRRFNENNVDLNRNGLFSAKEWEVETSRDANIAGYEDFSEGLFNPPNPSTLLQALMYQFLSAFGAKFSHPLFVKFF